MSTRTRIVDSFVVPILARVYIVTAFMQALARRAVTLVLGAPAANAPPPPPVPPETRMPAIVEPPARRIGMLPYMAVLMPLEVDPLGVPVAMVHRDGMGRLYLALLVDGDDEADRWVYACITGGMHADIVGGLIDTRDAITGQHVYVVDRAVGPDAALRIWALAGSMLPSAYLPAAGERYTAEEIATALATWPPRVDSSARGVTS